MTGATWSARAVKGLAMDASPGLTMTTCYKRIGGRRRASRLEWRQTPLTMAGRLEWLAHVWVLVQPPRLLHAIQPDGHLHRRVGHRQVSGAEVQDQLRALAAGQA